MNSLPDSDYSVEPGERFVDAALREHARDQSPMDDELVHRILAETVNRPSRPSPAHQPGIDRQTLLIGSVAVAALIALAVLVLSSMPFTSERGTDEFFLTVEGRPHYPSEPEVVASPGAWRAVGERPFEGKVFSSTEPARLDTIELSATNNALPLVVPFSPSIEEFPQRSEQERRFRISADNIERSGEAIYYTGNVVVEHSDFKIEAEQVTVLRGDGDGPRITASSALVEQPLANRTVGAASLTFDPAMVEMKLSGVFRFSTSGNQHKLERDDILVLSESSYSVERANAFQYASPAN